MYRIQNIEKEKRRHERYYNENKGLYKTLTKQLLGGLSVMQV